MNNVSGVMGPEMAKRTTEIMERYLAHKYPVQIPWQPFRNAFRQKLDPTVLCLWWIPNVEKIEVFTGRVAYWGAMDCAFVSRKYGSVVRVGDGAFYAIITPPTPEPKPMAIDDAIDLPKPLPLNP